MYENTDKIFTILSTVITALGDVMLPRISNLLASNEKSKAEKLFKYALRICIISSCAFTFGIISIAHEFIPIFLGKEFYECIKLVTWTAPSIIIVAFSVTIRKQYLIPRYKNKVYIYATVTGLLINIIANLILIPKYDALGAVFSTLIAEAVVMIIQFIMIRKELNYAPFVKDILVFCIIGIIMYLSVRVVTLLPISNSILLVIEIVVGIIVYLMLTFVYMKVTNDELLLFFKSVFKKKKNY
jgi:O-antigen/teichoic acid export membrane protein